MCALRELDQHDADVVHHREQHLAQVLGLRRTLLRIGAHRRCLDAVHPRDALDDRCDLVAECRDDGLTLVLRRGRQPEQKCRGQRVGIETLCAEKRGGTQRARQQWLAISAARVANALLRHFESRHEALAIGARIDRGKGIEPRADGLRRGVRHGDHADYIGARPACAVSAMCARTMLAKSSSARMPSARPAPAAKRAGHVDTIRSIAGSYSQRTRSATASPATVRSAFTMSPTATQSPGTLIERDCTGAKDRPARESSDAAPRAAPARRSAATSCPTMRLSMTALGDCSHMRVEAATGQFATLPARGSRMIELANDDAALFGLPGRTTIVGKRSDRPSMKPLRLMSLTSNSPIAFCVPYDDCGISGASSGTGSGSAPPNTASELAKTSFGGDAHVRQRSSRLRVASTLTRMPTSKSASACPLTTAAR